MNVLDIFPGKINNAFAKAVAINYVAITAVSLLLLFIVIVTGVFFGIRYRSLSSAHRYKPPSMKVWIEVVFIAIPLFFGVILFSFGAKAVVDHGREYPKNGLTIFVIGKQWIWKFVHENGVKEAGELHLPSHTPIRLVMVSEDVIHSFGLPDFRLKQDVLPDRYTELWFEPISEGTFPLYCNQYCGSFHARMGGQIKITSKEEYELWLAKEAFRNHLQQPEDTNNGEKIYERYGCASCHGANGRGGIAPRLDNLLGKHVHFSNSDSLIANETYYRDSILFPARKVVFGFPDTMPSFQGRISEEELVALIQYLTSLRGVSDVQKPLP